MLFFIKSLSLSLDMKNLQTFFESITQTKADEIIPLPASGSARKNFIASAGTEKFVITQNENTAENRSFLYFSEVFSSLQLHAPTIIGVSDDQKSYIQSYLGDETLSQIIEKEGLSERVISLVKKSLLQLFEFQTKTKDKIDYSQSFEYKAYNHIPIIHDLFYFKFMFVDVLEIEYQKSLLIREFYQLSEIIENLEPKGLMMRDFQARNIMVKENNVYFIDYQSAMYGTLLYDVVSFLYQAKANFPESFRKEMIAFYIELFDNEDEKTLLRAAIMPIRLIRNLQVLGAYGFRGLVQKKEHFLKSIPQGIENLKQTALEWEVMKNFPELFQLIQKINKKQILY